MTIIDYIIVPAGWILGNIIFNNFEKHLPWYRRFIKLMLTMGVLYSVHYFFGRVSMYSVLALMGVGMVVLHAWWFPKNDINGLTAEPYFRYLRLIDKMKGN
ncbi:MAG: hypothetical protein HYT62_00905 [Candidatus Yanofskybacteria bacterium]|nr:hypothetical protein [Candidatus Yanofskybacteria bacterium]